MGRPREFDIDKAADTALDLFWRNGYDKTSLADLTQALKITPPSFYFAFGSKERLFKKVLERYMSSQFGFFEVALRQPTSLGVATAILEGSVEVFSNPAHPGCLCVNSTSPCSKNNDPVHGELAKLRSAVFVRLCKRFREAKARKDLPADADPNDLARYIMAVGWGMALAAQSGASRRELRRTVATALKVWPG